MANEFCFMTLVALQKNWGKKIMIKQFQSCRDLRNILSNEF